MPAPSFPPKVVVNGRLVPESHATTSQDDGPNIKPGWHKDFLFFNQLLEGCLSTLVSRVYVYKGRADGILPKPQRATERCPTGSSWAISTPRHQDRCARELAWRAHFARGGGASEGRRRSLGVPSGHSHACPGQPLLEIISTACCRHQAGR
jgi:hypothetical protein